jgi:3-phenylpropionate/cinnamic acid dioxygenase small subunit
MADDRAEIENLLARYCELFDSGDFEGYSQLFADGSVSGHVGSDAVRKHQEDSTILYNGLPHTRHLTTNIHIEIADDGQTAEARSYVTVFQALEDFPLQPIFMGQYQDKLKKVDGRWRFSERVAEPYLAGDISRHATAYPPPGPLEHA